jgi:TrmH family RNA methyltransferase
MRVLGRCEITALQSQLLHIQSKMTNHLNNLRVLLMQSRNPLNIGAVARAMSNFGALRLRVVNPYEVAFRDARSAVGASELLAKAELYDDIAPAVADCQLVVGTTAIGERDLQHRSYTLEVGARTIKKQLQTGRVALLFGSERYGLSNQELSHCHWVMRIPTREEHGSMNLGQAAAVCLYELARGRKATLGKNTAAQKNKAAATSAEMERMTQVFLEVLHESGYIKPRAVAADEKLRRLVWRLKLNSNDAEVLLGMFRQIAWKVGATEKQEKSAKKK